MPPKPPRFTDGEKVLCFHGPLLYEAKCLKSQIRDKHMKYYIHYSGWNKNWDEWVPECRILKYCETNLQKQKELEKTHLKTKKTKASKVTIKKEPVDKDSEKASTSEKPTKSKAEKRVAFASTSQVFGETQPPPKKKKVIKKEPVFIDEPKVVLEVKIDIPESLRWWLVDDNDLITRQKKILNLPARVTVDHVVAGYIKDKVSVKGISQIEENTTVVMANKIRDCFNVLLGKMLLYKFERPQYAEVLSEYPDCDVCQIYSAVHLLRMFTKMGSLLQPVADNCSPCLDYLNDFTKYMSMNLNFFSLDDYVVASPEYHRRAL